MTAPPSSRPHQVKAEEMIRQSVRSGKKRPLVAAPCAFGKTHLAAKILRSVQLNGRKGVFICDRIKLVSQTIAEFDRFGVDFGVMQGIHERSAPSKTIQIASVQTLQSWSKKRAANNDFINESQLAYEFMTFDVFIIDECHITYEYIKTLMEENKGAIFIGLSATPYSKGLGTYYNDLLVPITSNELLELDYLTPIRYYGGAHIDQKGLGSRKLKTGGYDFNPKIVAERTENDTVLNGDIIKNWLKWGENSQTIAFSPSIKHSKFLVDEFRKAGVAAEHIDGYMDDDDRTALYEAHNAGEFKVLSCSQLLNTGYDAPQVKCLIDCYPIKSVISYVQRGGRIMRKFPGKEYSIYLDHAGNFARFGPCEDIVPESLDDGEKKFNEREQIREKKEPKSKECPSCYQQFVGVKCSCGYEIPITEVLETDNTELVELKSNAQSAIERRNKQTSADDKIEFYGGLKTYAVSKGYKAGWAANAYKERFGVWPNKYKNADPVAPSDAVLTHVQYLNIKRAKSAKFTKRAG